MSKFSFDILSLTEKKFRNGPTITVTSVCDPITNFRGHAVAGFYTEIDNSFILLHFQTSNKVKIMPL